MFKITKNSVLFVLSGLFFLNSVNAAVIQVANPGNDNNIRYLIQKAVTNAVNGDVISLPAGTFVLDSNVNITKFISFRGAGIENTILYRRESVTDNTLSNNSAWDGMLKFNINNTASSNIVVSDITFRSKSPITSVATDYGIKMIKCVDFLITRCRFEYFGNAAVYIKHADTLARGLICDNELYFNAKGVDGLGLGYGVVVYGENLQWVADPLFGSDNFIFIENNTFELHRHSVAAGGAGLYVVRNNDFKDNLLGDCIFMNDARGGTPGSSNYFSTRAIEVYNNTIINSKFENGDPIVPGSCVFNLTGNAIVIRAEAVVYQNTISGYTYGCGINTDNFPYGTGYPIKYGPGYLSGMNYGASHTGTDPAKGNGDLFYWNNTFTHYPNSSCGGSSMELYNYDAQYFKLNRDYHTVPKPGYTAFTYPHPLRSLSPQPTQQTQQWVNIFKGSANADDIPNVITTDASGNVYVTGSSCETSSSLDYRTIKYSSSGTELWKKIYNGTANDTDAAGAIFVDGGGNVYVTGSSVGSGTAFDYLTIKYDSLGNAVWTSRYNYSLTNGWDEATSITVDAFGNAYVTGRSVGETGYYDYLTIKYNSQGDTIWTRRYRGTSIGTSRAVAVSVDGSGNTVVTGFSYGGTTQKLNIVTIKYNASGSTLWTSIYNNPGNNGNEEPSSMAIDLSGNVFVTGRSYTSSSDANFVTVKYNNSSGLQQWATVYNGTGNGVDESKSIAVDGLGNTYVTGNSSGSGTNNDYATIKYNTTGAQQWVSRYNKADDFATSIALDNAGTGYVYVTGKSSSASASDFATVIYNLMGDQLQVLEYNGVENGIDGASGIKADVAGNVYVTGYSTGSGTGLDFTTIKYCYTTQSNRPSIIDSSNNDDLNPGNSFINGESNSSEIKSRSVEIASFISSVNKNNVTLNWETNWETDNSGFEIERSPGNNSWTAIANVEGNGTANSTQTYTYSDRSIPIGTYYYRLKQTDLTGNFEYFNLSSEVIVGVPTEYDLLQNYPNPFNPTTSINFEIPTDGKVSLRVFDISGKEVATLINEVKTADYYSYSFDASSFSSGIYFYNLSVNGFIASKKMLLVK